jgi:hypothetical protein
VPEALVCVQWAAAAAPAGAPADDAGGLYPFVEAHVLLGVTAHAPPGGAARAAFADAPRLLRVAAKPVGAVRAVQRRASEPVWNSTTGENPLGTLFQPDHGRSSYSNLYKS